MDYGTPTSVALLLLLILALRFNPTWDARLPYTNLGFSFLVYGIPFLVFLMIRPIVTILVLFPTKDIELHINIISHPFLFIRLKLNMIFFYII